MTAFPSITHVAITVTDLSVSIPWYSALFGAQPVLDEDTGPFRHAVFALDAGVLFGLHAFPGGNRSVGFNPQHAGLDHIAFGCADRAELERWLTRLDELGIKHGDIADAHYGSGLSFKDPDDIALELFAPPA
jgi:glyoxylase I family protein